MEYPGYGFFSHKIKDREIDKKTKYTTHNTTSVVNVTSYENRTVLENARLRRRNLNAARRRRRTTSTAGAGR